MPALLKHYQQISLFLFCVLFFSGCSHSDSSTSVSNTDNKYSLYIMTQDANEYIVQTNSLAEGFIEPSKSGVLLQKNDLERNLIVRDGFYYFMNNRSGKFYKYALEHKSLKKVDSVSIKDLYISNYTWSADTLLLIGTDINDTLMRYVKVHVTDMAAEEGIIPVKITHPSYNLISVGLSHIKHGKLFVGYTYHVINELNFTTSDTAYIAVLNYNTMKILDILKETRSTYPGSENLVEPAYFTTEKGDLYFLTCPGVALGNRIEKPTALLRIKENDEKIDSTYFFNISDSPINNHAYSIYYLGKNKALIRSERKDLYKDWNEHWKVPHYEFYILDIEKQSIDKLKLPLDKGTRRQCVIIENNIAYISLNSDTEGNYIWIYNSIDGSLHKGLSLSPETSFILRIDKLK